MDPFLAQSLLDTSRHDSSRSTLRNPDGLFSAREMPPPDPVGKWVVDAASVSHEVLVERSSHVRSGWRLVLAGWTLMLRRLARDSR